MVRWLSILCLCGLLPSAFPVRAEEPPPPKVRRSYSERANLSGSTSSSAQPDTKSTARIPDQQIPGGSSSLMNELETSHPPALPPPTRDPKSQRGEKEKPWSLKEPADATKPSGWGWLADDILRGAQTNATETSKRDRLDDPFELGAGRDEQEDWNSNSEKDREPTASERTELSTSAKPLTEEEMVEARLKEDRAESNPGWRPVGADQDGDSWRSSTDTRNDPRDRTVLSGMAFVPPEVVKEPVRQNAPDVDALTRSSASPDYLQNLNRLPEPDSQAGLRGSSRSAADISVLPSFNARPAGSDAGALNAGASSGFLSSGPSFGGLGAVEVPPTLGSAAPLAPALTLPSQAASTPAMGVMGSEMEARPKTLPW